MKRFPVSIVLGSIAAALFATSAMADHNSVNGAGWANMPNDVHNIQIEDDLSPSEFRTLISKGGVRDLDNRYDTSTTTTTRGSGASAAAAGGGRR